jgi:aspartyl-tRNA(Asn)/glutamyl-tRNA(Gln) amidotransferase subunit C
VPLSSDQVKRIAHLARIEISETEAAQTLAQLNDILVLIERMQAVDTAGVQPMTHPHGQALRLREDIVSEGDRRASFQSVAPQVEAGLYLVPKVIE